MKAAASVPGPVAPPPDLLQPGETLLLEARRHPLSVVDGLLGGALLWLLVVGGTAYVLGTFYPEGWLPVGVPVLLVATLVYAALALSLFWRVRTSRYLVTEERVYKSHGRLRFSLDITTFDKVTDLHVRQSMVGRLRGFGTVRVETAGAGLALEGLPDPMAAKTTIERARRAFVERLVQEQRARTRRSRAAEPASAVDAAATGVGNATAALAAAVGAGAGPFADDPQPVWQGGPAASFFLGRAVLAGLAGLLGIGVLVASAVLGPMLFPGLFLLALALGNGLSAWAQYRHTRYTVLPDGVVVTSGWLTRRRVETTFDKVTDVATYQDILGRLLDYGQITINTAGGTTAPVVFRGLAEPERVKATVDEARRAWRRRRG